MIQTKVILESIEFKSRLYMDRYRLKRTYWSKTFGTKVVAVTRLMKPS